MSEFCYRKKRNPLKDSTSSKIICSDAKGRPSSLLLTLVSTPTTFIKLTELFYEKVTRTVILIYKMKCINIVHPISRHSLACMEAPAWRIQYQGRVWEENSTLEMQEHLHPQPRPRNLDAVREAASSHSYWCLLGQPLTSPHTYSLCPPNTKFTTQ